MAFLKGKKTYLIALGMGVVTVLHSLGIVSDQIFQTISVILAGGGLATLRAAVSSPNQ